MHNFEIVGKTIEVLDWAVVRITFRINGEEQTIGIRVSDLMLLFDNPPFEDSSEFERFFQEVYWSHENRIDRVYVDRVNDHYKSKVTAWLDTHLGEDNDYDFNVTNIKIDRDENQGVVQVVFAGGGRVVIPIEKMIHFCYEYALCGADEEDPLLWSCLCHWFCTYGKTISFNSFGNGFLYETGTICPPWDSSGKAVNMYKCITKVANDFRKDKKNENLV